MRNRKFRTTPRTAGCKRYKDESKKTPASSNFISHSLVCSTIPKIQTWAAYEARKGEDAEDDQVGATSVLGAQRNFMQDFGLHGCDNPEKQVTRKGFREFMVKGIVEDDLPYSLGEKGGMSKLFEYILPHGFAIPSHQTVRRDLDILYEKLNDKINQQLKVSAHNSSVRHAHISNLH